MTVDSAAVDEPDRERFVWVEDGETAELDYRREGDRLVLVHTEVPGPLSGRGIAARLVQAAMARAAAEHLTVVPWCPYARRWLSEHQETYAGQAIDWS